ncbi:MAG: hypothetical protein IPG93_24320 [Burkholderiales bacterium]|nr:hypothetical protein [Burkholderiales bacterium]
MTHPPSLRQLGRQTYITVGLIAVLALWALIELWSLARARRTLRSLHQAPH